MQEPYYKEEGGSIFLGDVLDILKQMNAESVDMVITSPPYYGLRNYGVDGQIGLEETFDEFLDKMMLIFAEVKRVLKKTGTFWLNMGDCFGGSNNGANDYEEKGKSSVPLTSRGPGAKRLKYWGGNVEKSTLTNPERQQLMGRSGNQKCMLMQPERMAIRMIDEQGWILRNKIKWCKQVYLFKDKITKGSVMPTSVKDRFNESGEELYFFVKSKKYYFDLDAVRLPIFEPNIERPRIGQNQFQTFNYRVRDAERKAGQPQFKATEEEIKNYRQQDAKEQGMHTFYSHSKRIKPNTGMVKYDISERQKELKKRGALPTNQRVQGFYDEFGGQTNPKGKNLPTIWQIGSEPHNFQREFGVEVDHFASFPQALCEIPIKAGSPKGGVVLDIFSGSGTTCLVAKKLGRKFIGIDLNKEYCDIAVKRIKEVPQSFDF